MQFDVLRRIIPDANPQLFHGQNVSTLAITSNGISACLCLMCWCHPQFGHLDARMIDRHLNEMGFHGPGLPLEENVGNLVCPSSYDLGEAAKIVLLSVTEGEDKP